MKKLANILSIITLLIICIIDVSSNGNHPIFTYCVVLGMAFIAFGCIAVEAIDKIWRSEND